MTSDVQSPALLANTLIPGTLAFPVVGIGASAGGLQALISFFEAAAMDTGMAFVVVMHLSPTHESNASGILQRSTAMKVMEVTTSTLVEKNCVYVIAPNKQLEITDGHLTVRERLPYSGPPVAVDLLFRTLAQVHRERSFVVILSGTGSDGTASLSVVKDMGGVIIAQTPEDAGYGGMPKSAIDTGLVDFVLPVRQIPQKLVALWANAQRIHLGLPSSVDEAAGEQPAAASQDGDEEVLHEIIQVLRQRTGHDFQKYKRATVLRRIERRLQVREVATLSAYRDVLKEDRAESQALLKDMLIGVTQFFRDPEAFEAVERLIIPQLFEGKKPEDQLRVWSVACSTGEEIYSLAMLLAEKANTLAFAPEIQIFGSDIDERAIAHARAGLYPATIAENVSPARLAEHFINEEGRYRIKKPLRDYVLFANHNILRDPPFSKLDMISCRNLLIYLNRETHLQVLEMLHFALKPNGYLFLGNSESADAVTDFFVPIDKKHRIYRAKPSSRFARSSIPLSVTPQVAVPGVPVERTEKQKLSYAGVHQRALADYSPPSVLVDHQSNIVYMSEGTAQFLRHVSGEPSRNLVALVEPELRLELRTALFHAIQSSKSTETRRIRMERGAAVYFVNMTARPFYDGNTSTDFVLVIFHRTEQSTDEQSLGSAADSEDSILSGLEEELQRTREQLQDTIEHSETSNEELKASNEELQAINEELRSATEELETSKEELQSVNEELVTVNFELKNKVEETGKVNDDLQNLIASTDIATIFVDRGMRIKRYTPHACKLFNLIPGDVGRPLHDITHKLEYPELTQDATAAFETLKSVERVVTSIDSRWYIARLLPYRTVHDRIDGAVLTFVDITNQHKAEERARAGEEHMRMVAGSSKDYAIITMDKEGLITSFNSGAERMFGYSKEEIVGKPDVIIFTVEDRAADVPRLEKQRALQEGRAEDERWHLRKDGSMFYCSGVLTPLGEGDFHGYAKIGRDLTGKMENDSHKAERLVEAQTANAQKDEFLAIMSHELKHPLNLIHMNAEMLWRYPDVQATPQISRAVNAIRSASLSQAKIINDLLDLSRLHTGKLTLSPVMFDFSLLVESIVDMARSDPGSQDLSILFEHPTTEPLYVTADKVRMEQVVWNLLNNAIKFTPAGGTIQASITVLATELQLDISDSGQGIDPGLLHKVFDMFDQGAPSVLRGTKGLGIGLALVKQIVELHHGRVEATSEGLNKGAVFSVWLPRDASGTSKTEDRASPALLALAGIRILLLDDDQDGVDTFHLLLEMVGATVTSTTSASTAFTLLDQQHFDLIISDLAMPEMDGFTFMREIRKRSDCSTIPSLAITGFGRQQDIERATAAGFTGHISKPVEIDTVVQRIKELML